MPDDKTQRSARDVETGDAPKQPGKLAKVPPAAADNTAKSRKGG